MSSLIRKPVNLDHLNAGTKLGVDIYNDQGKIVVKAGFELTQDNIAKLKSSGQELFYHIKSTVNVQKRIWFDPERLRDGLHLAERIFLDAEKTSEISPKLVKEVTDYFETILTELKNNRSGICNIMLRPEPSDDYLYVHSLNTALMSLAFAYITKLGDQQTLEIAAGGFLHDIGHAVGDRQLLMSADPLNEHQVLSLKRHPHTGYEIMKKTSFSDLVKQAVLFHHERYDENGYPTTLPYSRLPISPKYVSIADIFEGLVNARPHRNGLGIKEGLRLLIERANTFLDYDMVTRFIRLVGPHLTANDLFYQYDQLVATSFNEIARITNTKEVWLRPDIEILIDAKGDILKKPFQVSLRNDLTRNITRIYSTEKSESMLVSIYKRTGRYQQMMPTRRRDAGVQSKDAPEAAIIPDETTSPDE